MPPYEHFEGSLVALSDEAFEQHAVIHPRARRMDNPPQVGQYPA
jgi:hypothetical protein